MNLQEISSKTKSGEIQLDNAINTAYDLGRNENEIEKLSLQLIELAQGNFVFVEYYTHTNSDCYKILNPYTKYKEDKQVLCKVEEGLKLALKTAVEVITQEKDKFYN
jgi:hypothetical protein